MTSPARSALYAAVFWFRRRWLRVLPPPPAIYAVGDRVHVEGDGLGHVQTVESWHDGKMGWRYEVRWLTPDNEPSCLCTFGIAEARLRKVGDNVLPQPRSAAWKAESHALYEQITAALEEAERCRP